MGRNAIEELIPLKSWGAILSSDIVKGFSYLVRLDIRIRTYLGIDR